MKHFIPLFALIALSYAQFTSTEGPSQIIGVPGPRWQGPFADNILGQPVGDTPEVAAAKAAHYQAHARILEIVPVLPSEEQYKALNYGSQQQVVPQQVVYVPQQPSYVAQQPSFVVQQTVTEVPVNIPSKVQAQQFVQLAEEIPRSELGEVPEVAAARKAHLAAYEEIKKLLPKLEETPEVVSGVYQPAVRQQVQFVTEKPQVVSQESHNVNQQVVAQVPQVLYQQSQNVQQPIQPVQQFVQFAEDVPRSELGEVPEVAAARKAHLAAYEEIKKLLPKLEESADVVQQPQFVYQVPQTVPVTQVPQVVFQQPQVVAQEPQAISHQAQSEVYKKQLQRNLEWFYNPQQFYTYVPQDTPEVAAAKVEHLKLLQSFL